MQIAISTQDLINNIEIFYPHISEKINNLWGNYLEFNEYMDTILFQQRNNPREGFPPFIFYTLIAIQDIHNYYNNNKILFENL